MPYLLLFPKIHVAQVREYEKLWERDYIEQSGVTNHHIVRNAGKGEKDAS